MMYQTPPSHHPHHRKRRIRKLRVFFAVSILLLLIASIILVWSAVTSPKKPDQAQAAASSGTVESSALADPSSLPAAGASISDTAKAELPSEPALETSAQPEKTGYDFSQPVPEQQPAELSYLDDAVFIGDSRTEGFILYNGLSDTTAYTHKGLMVDTAFTSPVVTLDGQKYTVMDALAKTSFSKVYVMLGINEAGWAYSDLFIEKYGEIIEKIREINPDALIYVQSILPVSAEVSANHDYLTNAKIDEYNTLLRQMAEDKEVYYLNVAESVAGADGALPAEAATDGIHLKKEYCLAWLDYLLSHTVTKSE